MNMNKLFTVLVMLLFVGTSVSAYKFSVEPIKPNEIKEIKVPNYRSVKGATSCYDDDLKKNVPALWDIKLFKDCVKNHRHHQLNRNRELVTAMQFWNDDKLAWARSIRGRGGCTSCTTSNGGSSGNVPIAKSI